MYWQAATATLLAKLLDHQRVGLVTDIDGTVSPIVNDPDAAQVTPRNRALLEALHGHLALVAAISGRAVDDVRQRVGLPELVYVGNHGLEWWIDGRVELAPDAVRFRPALEAALAAAAPHRVPGMILEDKGATVSIHYRQTSDPDHTRAALTPVLEQIAAQHGLKLFQGRMVFEIRPPVAVDKGSAFRQLIERHSLDAALYLGDDTTDADALRTARELRAAGTCYALALGVESDDMPPVVRENADVLLRGVQDVESFLAWLLDEASASFS